MIEWQLDDGVLEFGSMARIFLIDDDPVMLAMLSETLREAGHEVTTAANGWEALREFRPAWHELVITDVLMPYVDGKDLVRVLRRETPRIPVIAMSGSFGEGDSELLAAVTRLGATHVLKKPFFPEQLLDTVNLSLSPGAGEPS